MCREIEMGVAVAQLALTDAGLDAESRDRDRCGVVYGCDYIMSLPEEFSIGIAKCLDEEGSVSLRSMGPSGQAGSQPFVVAQVPAQHAGQPHRDLQRFARTQQFDHGARGLGRCGRSGSLQHDPTWACRCAGRRFDRFSHPLRCGHSMHRCRRSWPAIRTIRRRCRAPSIELATAVSSGEGAGAMIFEIARTCPSPRCQHPG